MKKDALSAAAMVQEVQEGQKEAATAFCFMGTEVVEGTGVGIIITTGTATRMGQVGQMINNADQEESPLQRKLTALGVRLGIASIAISTLVLIVGLAANRGGDASDPQPLWLQMVLLAVSLTVAVVPEGLPACVTITLAVGMHHMVTKNALIKNLHSVETLGSASVICSDKTGTLTAGVMTMVRLWMNGEVFKTTQVGYNPQGKVLPLAARDDTDQALKADSPYALPLLTCLLGTNKNTLVQFNEKDDVWECTGNATERPLVVAAAKAGLDKAQVLQDYEAIHTNPFNSTRKRQSVVLQVKTKASPYGAATHIAVANGAPNVLLELCSHIAVPGPEGVRTEALTADTRAAVMAQVDAFSDEAFRVLATAYKVVEDPSQLDADEVESGLVLAGLVASIDPERAVGTRAHAPVLARAYTHACVCAARTRIRRDHPKIAQHTHSQNNTQHPHPPSRAWRSPSPRPGRRGLRCA